MKTTVRILALLLTAIFLLSFAGCAKAPEDVEGDSAEFVRAAARAVTARTDGPELFYADKWSLQYDLDTEPTLQPWFAMLRFKAEQDPDDPELVHYSCRIPGAVGMCFNMAYDMCFRLGPRYSKWVPVEGDVWVHTAEDGSRQIDISRTDNVFSAYAALRYVNPMFFQAEGVDISHGLSDEDFSDGVFVLLNRACGAYASALGADAEEYAEEVIVPELEAYQSHMMKIVRASACKGYGFRNSIRGMSLGAKIFWIVALAAVLAVGIYFLVLTISAILEIRKIDRAGKQKKGPARRIAAGDVRTQKVLDEIACFRAGTRSFREFCEESSKNRLHLMHMDSVTSAAEMAVVLARNPEDVPDPDNTMRLLCKNIHLGLRPDAVQLSGEKDIEAYRHELMTAAGWSAAALGRILARKMTADSIASNLERLSAAIDKSNETTQTLQEKYERRKTVSRSIEMLIDSQTGKAAANVNLESLALEQANLEEEIAQLECEYSKGLGGFMLDNGDLPLAYLVFLLRDSQNRFPRFIKQGAVMGLVDWLVENRTHPEAAKLLQTVVSVRNDMIRSDNDLTFFEVRVPKGCSRPDYAVLLADVLHCSNPSLTYGDTEKLLSTAEEEVPGVMDMLYACPLRLIDPANRQTMGFYQFKPYVHAMWVQYTPPLKEGKVISRYHEVDDRTKPLSSGLNLQLFRDCYAVIPTLFHEYQHFMGDRNEASVFLKTQLFSIRFYKKYREADAKSDAVFTQLANILGLPPKAANRSALNGIIERYYGKQLSREEGEAKANEEIASINSFVDRANRQETWDPDVKMPRLAKGEDERNRDLVWDIVLRFATVAKSLTEKQFEDILSGKARTVQEIAGIPFSLPMEEIADGLGMNEGVDRWLGAIIDRALGRAINMNADAVTDVFRSNGLDLTDCRIAYQPFLFDPAASDASSLPKYLKQAGNLARDRGENVLRPEHLAEALLRHPTKCMKNAGIVRKKR